MQEIKLTQQKTALVDDIDVDLNKFKWQAQKHSRSTSMHLWYAIRHVKRSGITRTIRLHRVVLERKIGRTMMNTEYTDHINNNTLDNRRSNLRVASRSQNIANQFRQIGQKSSQFKGVYLNKNDNNWRAIIGINGTRIHLGCFREECDAAEAYNVAAIKYFGEFAKINIISGGEFRGCSSPISFQGESIDMKTRSF